MPLKRVYLVHRNPSLRHDEFAPRWAKHAELAQQFPELVYLYPRLNYSCTLEQAPGIPGASQRYDGVGMLWLRSDDLASVQPTDPRMRPTMQADELRVFTDKMLNAVMTVDEQVLLDGRGARFGLISFLQKAPGQTAQGFTEALRRQASAVREHPQLAAAVHRHVIGAVTGTPTFACDGVDEMWFRSAEDARQAGNSAAYRRLVLEARQGFCLPEPLTLLTGIGHAWSAADDPHPKPFP